MKKRSRIILICILGVLIAAHLGLFLFPFKELKEFKNSPYSTVYYDCNGQLLQISSLEDGSRREKLEWKELPKELKRIFIQAEDKRFYFHNGSDLPALVNALFQNLKHKKVVRGGSTITMQLVKIICGDKDLTVKRKLHDIFYAHVIETKFSKKKILELYLNSLYFGQGATGCASAARTFYGCSLDKLSKEQLCCLAVIPRNPTLYNPFTNRHNCAERACALYNRIYRKALTVNEFEQFLPERAFSYPFEAPHYIRDVAAKEASADSKSLTLSINLELQNYAERIVRDALEQAQGSRISNASLLLIDNKTGKVLSWIGSADFFDELHNGQIDGVLVKNQPGSSMKPFLYALALETKTEDGKPLYEPSSIIADIPQEFGDQKLYIPSNFNNRYNGPVRFRIALASSLNVPAVSILNTIGVNNYLEKLYSLGFDSLKHGGELADLGLALGAGEVTLKELVTAFAIFARDGKDFYGNQIYREDTARIIASILSDKGARALGFGYSQTFETNYPSIFKTGTSNQYQDIVALGSTMDYTIGVWMGNFSGETVVGKTGSSLPAWIAKKVMDYLEEGKPLTSERQFPEPGNYVRQKICSLSGHLAGPDCPASVYEYISKDSLTTKENCSWHQKKNGELLTLYPPEYQQWARKTRPELQIKYSDSPLYIKTPKDNSLFYYSQLQKEKQAITVEVFGGTEDSLYVYYDNEPFTQVFRPFCFTLPVERGNHSCTVICGYESDEINFTVK